MKVTIYTDGSARGNPDGPGGYGTILSYADGKGVEHLREFSQGYVRTTNNRMELMAAIVGLEALIKPCKVELYSDSKYVVDAFNQNISYTEENPITMNPFRIQREELNVEKIGFLKNLIMLIWKGSNGEVSKTEDRLIEQVITEYYEAYFVGFSR